MPSGKHLTRWEKERIVALYQGGMDGPTVARKLNIVARSAYRVLVEYGVPRRHGNTARLTLKPTARGASSRNRKIIEAFNDGHTCQAIAGVVARGRERARAS